MAAQQLATTTARAPPEPEFVLRGHSHAVTALRFLDEQRLVSGGARAVVSWCAAISLPRVDGARLLLLSESGQSSPLLKTGYAAQVLDVARCGSAQLLL